MGARVQSVDSMPETAAGRCSLVGEAHPVLVLPTWGVSQARLRLVFARAACHRTGHFFAQWVRQHSGLPA